MSGRTAQRPIMPRPSFPPTPAPSTDITGKCSANAAHLDSSFALPPAAIASNRGSTSSSTASHASDSSYRPLSPTSPATTIKTSPATRKRASTSQGLITKDDYSLPPPPTRSRKIIQMKPKESQEPVKPQPPAATNAKTGPASSTGGKRKQAGNPTAAGRKIARKTAHSLIERRRRSKMNEEFGVLKDMIPACAGQEMHKLAILQASIEYLRYLESCVAGLKASHRSRRASPTPTSAKNDLPPPPVRRDEPEDDEDEDQDEDEEMSDAVSPTHVARAEPKPTYHFTNVSPAIYPSDRSVYSTNTSPNLLPRDYAATISPNIHPRDYASPALQPSDPRHYSLASSIRSTATSPSTQASPAFGGQTPSQSQLAQFHNPFTVAPSSRGSTSAPSAGTFTLTSPALKPQADREDHEATEALLMIAGADRRSWSGARGMSVKDLLSG
ncbi:hypothetical protein K505DRAFT_375403 [Melanomma pulvis-pyrius CBS 109.77]|uniref:BHLH domain-containing protein n=1 Tax=Melanomma pulvis-pyrius CBS 109.77 TaxID=1314802 RepID=A0A6A6XAC8_9PLEO|nr:hypothetical protein K505DRAFT_375403 [Melanomma pulvis-pyrius CBS 109.77]